MESNTYESKAVDSSFIEFSTHTEPELNAASNYIGTAPIYAYNNVESNIEDERVSCGQAAIATLFDYYNVSPYPLKAGVVRPPAVDGKMHFSNQLVEYVMRDYPPAQLFNFRFTTREVIQQALRNRGIKWDEAYAGAGGDGEFERQQLMNVLAKTRRPVLVLIDLFDLSRNYKGMGSYDNWYAMHWAFVYGYNSTHVMISSWTRVFAVPWSDFMKGWHCGGLPYPNNYYAIFTHK